MICGGCLTICPKYQSVPCGHHVCQRCFSDYTHENKTYRCPTCLLAFPLSEELSNASAPLPQISMAFYCLQCEQSFTFQQMKTGMHRKHTFDLLERCLPKIKQRVLQKFNKRLVIENVLLLNIQKQADQPYYDRVEELLTDIQTYFSQQKQIILEKQRKIISEVMQIKDKMAQFLERKRHNFLYLYEQLHEINQTLEGFLTENVEFQTIDGLGLLRQQKEQQLVTKIKLIEKEAFQIPAFICQKPVDHSLDLYCLLKYPGMAKPEPDSAETQKSMNRRVNLSSKVFRRMNCL